MLRSAMPTPDFTKLEYGFDELPIDSVPVVSGEPTHTLEGIDIPPAYDASALLGRAA